MSLEVLIWIALAVLLVMGTPIFVSLGMASITVLLICLQLKHFALGATVVFSFSIGLALTLVASGAIAALSLKHATKRWPGFSEFSRKAPWISAALITVVGIYMSLHGLSGILA